MYKTISLTAVNPCPNCGSEFQPTHNIQKNCQDKGLQFDCVLCGNHYSYLAVSVNEEKKTDVKSLYCDICEKHFSQLSALKRHSIVHSGNRPHCCEECDKSFKTKAALKRHRIIHTGECPFECSTCKRRFNQISNLRKHLVIHNNNCPFYCSTCGKGFNQLSNLKKHSVVHQDDIEESEKIKPDHNVITKGLEKTVTRPVLTFVKPAKS